MNHQIDQKKKLYVNGSVQWIFIRGNRNGSILLFVHGGPGASLVPLARGFEEPFKKDYLLIHWDQRGVGKSFESADFSKGFSLEQFTDDGLTVTQQIKEIYPEKPIILVGHSWGTAVGVKMVGKAPELFRSYISVGTNAHTLNAESYRYRVIMEQLENTGEVEDLQVLKEIGEPPWSIEKFHQWGEFLGRHVPMEKSFGQISLELIGEAIELCLKAGDYTERELEHSYTKGVQEAFAVLHEDYYAFSAIEQVPRLNIPVFFFHGSQDFNTPTHIVRDYFESLDAPKGKSWIEIEDCAHMIFYENSEAFLRILELAVKRC